ncbi:hypothetical protein EDC96DRAFT_550321 [Choanephora cucurbitarum]|nr:hypothetical protein EDC96DRAFT_550321 [Choanephora cucurbitarum]
MPLFTYEEMENFDGLSMSESFMETDTCNVVSEESNLIEPVTYDWYPSEPIDEVKAAWISIMQVLDEAKMPRKYQRRLVYRKMVRSDNKSTIKYDICPNGCYLYPADDTKTSVCLVQSCDMPRFCNGTVVI